MTNDLIPPKLMVFKDDITEYIADEVHHRAGRVYELYLFDQRTDVHICSFQANREAWFVGLTWSGGPDYESYTETQREQLFEDMLTLERQIDNPMVDYFGTDIDQRSQLMREYTAEEWTKFVSGYDNDHHARRALMEETVEYMRCNGYVY